MMVLVCGSSSVGSDELWRDGAGVVPMMLFGYGEEEGRTHDV